MEEDIGEKEKDIGETEEGEDRGVRRKGGQRKMSAEDRERGKDIQ